MRGLSGREWVILQDHIKPQNYLIDRFGPLVAQILANRGTDERVFDTTLKKLTHYSHIPNITEAVDAISRAVKRGERILIYGDYDVDGITGTVLLYHFLKRIKANVVYSLPNRMTGYGLNAEIIKKFENYAELIVTVDNGTTAVEEINSCKKPVLVIDHHNIGDSIPEAILVNPKLNPDAPNDIKEVSSVALVFYMVYLLSKEFNVDFDVREYLHLVAVGTLADVMPLNHLNRILVSKGIEVLNHIRKTNTPFKGAKVLFNYIKNSDEKITSRDIIYSAVPRLNAPGRMKDPILSAELLLSSDETKALKILGEIEELNNRRKDLVDKEYLNALKIAERQKDASLISVFTKDASNVGILGIIASRLSNTFEKPAIVLYIGKELTVGSARGVEGIDLYSGLKQLSYMFLKWGGHTNAAGLTMPNKYLKEFERKAQEVFSQIPYKKPKLYIDMMLDTGAINGALVNRIMDLEPFGEGFPEPLFLSQGMNLRKDPLSNERRVIFKSDEGLTFVSWDIKLNKELLRIPVYNGRVVYSIDLRRRYDLNLIDIQIWL